MNPIVEIVREFRFEAAHMLPNHAGKCKELHGHSYVAEIHVEGPVNRQEGASEEGMVLDYAAIDAAWRSCCEPLLDHRYLNDTLGALVGPTTAENIAEWILGAMTEALEDSPGIVQAVLLRETAKSQAIVTR